MYPFPQKSNMAQTHKSLGPENSFCHFFHPDGNQKSGKFHQLRLGLVVPPIIYRVLEPSNPVATGSTTPIHTSAPVPHPARVHAKSSPANEPHQGPFFWIEKKIPKVLKKS